MKNFVLFFIIIWFFLKKGVIKNSNISIIEKWFKFIYNLNQICFLYSKLKVVKAKPKYVFFGICIGNWKVEIDLPTKS